MAAKSKKTPKPKALKPWSPPRRLKGKPTLNRTELAKATGFSEPTLDKWIAAGCPVAQVGGRGKSYQFHLNQVKSWRAEQDRLKKQEEADKAAIINANQSSLDLDGGEASGSDAQVRLLAPKEQSLFYDTVIKHTKAGIARGDLVRRDDVAADNAQVFKMLSARLDALPDVLERLLSLDPSATAQVRMKVDAMRNDAARDLMKYDDLSDTSTTGGDSSGAVRKPSAIT